MGFEVFLLTYHERLGDHHAYGYGVKGDVDNMLHQAKEIAVKWAQIAEKNKVEMYAPRKELQLFIGPEKALQWDRDILPEVRKAYSGNLVQGVPFLYVWDCVGKAVYEQESVPVNMSGYDYLGVDFYGSDVDTFDELEAFYARFLCRVEEIKKEFGLKGVVYEELGYPHHGIEAFWVNSSLTANEIMMQYYNITYRLGIDRIDGFFPWIWADGTYTLTENRKEYITPTKVISLYYSSNISAVSSIENIAAQVEVSPPVKFNISRTLLQEDFNNGTNWELGTSGSVSNGVLEIKGDFGIANLKNQSSREWTDYVFRGKFKPLDGEFSLHFRESELGSYEVLVRPIAILQLLKFSQSASGERMDVVRGLIPLVEFDKWHTFAIYAKGSTIQIFIDNEKITDYLDVSPVVEGAIAISVRGDAIFDDIIVEELN
jgi:hypothetical protein